MCVSITKSQGAQTLNNSNRTESSGGRAHKTRRA
jgi:hypothetical protein